MAITLVNTATATNPNSPPSTSLALPASSLTGGNLLVLCMRWDASGGSTAVSSIADTAGNSFTRACTVNDGAGSATYCEIWYAKNALGNGSNVVTVTFNGTNGGYMVLESLQYSGCDAAAPLDQTATKAQASAT